MGSSREYPTRPIPGVGVIAFQGDAVLLIRRGQEPRRGEWSLPGGAIELGETARAAALREFAEECGGEIDLRGVVEVVDVRAADEVGRWRYHYVLADFWAEWRGGELHPASDAGDARWVLLAELAAFSLPPVTRAVIERAAALRRLARAGELPPPAVD